MQRVRLRLRVLCRCARERFNFSKSSMNKTFSLERVRALAERPAHLKAQGFARVFEMAQRVVHTRATQGKYDAVFEVPKFLLGFPPYDAGACASFVRGEFVRRGFVATCVRKGGDVGESTHYVRIDWRAEEAPERPERPFHARVASTKRTKKASTATASVGINGPIVRVQHRGGALDSVPVNPENVARTARSNIVYL